MFGFVRLSPQNLKSTPRGAEQEILVTREDIYRNMQGADPILLLRKGFELTREELPRFLKNGAKTHQFHYKHTGEPLRPIYQKPAQPAYSEVEKRSLPRGASNPIERDTIPRGFKQKRALIVEPDQKNLKRLIDCLFISGLKLDRIHPVRLVSNTPWAVEKYRPQILVADYELPGDIDGLTLLQAFAELSYVETLILTVSPEFILSEEENVAIEALNHRKRIKIVTKPVNRFDLQRILFERKSDSTGVQAL